MSKQVILCVDDEKLILSSLKEQLLLFFNNAYEVEISESAEEALELINYLKVNKAIVPLVIADYQMPSIKGDELLKEIHKILPSTVKVMLTGHATLEGVTNAINEANLYRYMSKPWHKEDLLLTVSEAIKSYNRDRELELKNNELLEINKNLENLVEVRTAALLMKNKELEWLSHHDFLTGLLNRKAIFEKLEEMAMFCKNNKKACSIIMLDIDHFKTVNDQCGHIIGDEVLKLVSKKIMDLFGEKNYIGRYGGEEFIVILPETNGDDAREKGEELRIAVQKIELYGCAQKITISGGITELTNLSVVDAIKKADELLYAAKASGRNAIYL